MRHAMFAHRQRYELSLILHGKRQYLLYPRVFGRYRIYYDAALGLVSPKRLLDGEMTGTIDRDIHIFYLALYNAQNPVYILGFVAARHSAIYIYVISPCVNLKPRLARNE